MNKWKWRAKRKRMKRNWNRRKNTKIKLCKWATDAVSQWTQCICFFCHIFCIVRFIFIVSSFCFFLSVLLGAIFNSNGGNTSTSWQGKRNYGMNSESIKIQLITAFTRKKHSLAWLNGNSLSKTFWFGFWLNFNEKCEQKKPRKMLNQLRERQLCFC